MFACIILLPVIAPSLYFWGSRSETTFACSMCGGQMVKKRCVGLVYYSKEFETDDSRWYRAKGLKSHPHDWKYVCSNEQDWGGGRIHTDGFGTFLYPLHLLREVEKRTDMTQFKELVEEYYDTREDRMKIKDFVQHCDDIFGSNHPFHSGITKTNHQHDP
jgi:hypothetical protein